MHNTNILEDQPVAWTPTPEVIERAQLTRFMKQVGVSTWVELYQYSINDVEKFTEEVLKFLDIKFDPPYEKLLDLSNGVEFPNWFVKAPLLPEEPLSSPPVLGGVDAASAGGVVGAGLNITEMCLDRWQTDDMKDQPAVIWEGEDGAAEPLTYDGLLTEVEKCAAGLSVNGFGKGDAIGIHLPMMVETVVTLLAINRIGAIAVPVFSGYGVEAVASRMNAVSAKALFTCNGFYRRGKPVASSIVALDAADKCPTIAMVCLIPMKRVEHRRLTMDERRERTMQRMKDFTALTDAQKGEYQRNKEAERKIQQEEMYKALNLSDEAIAEIEKQLQESQKSSGGTSGISFGIYDLKKSHNRYGFRISQWGQLLDEGSRNLAGHSLEPTSAEDPLIILYTSGTTGKPKGIAHTHASFPIKAAQDMAFGTDVGKGTRISWYTDIGWMMGPWLIYGALINGATICIYDGAPDYPTPDRMWEFCAKHKVEILGISPTLVRSLASHESEPPASAGGTNSEANDVQKNETASPTKATPPAHAGGSDKKRPFERHDLSSLRMFASTGEPWNPAPWWWLFEKVGDSKLPIINYSGGTEISGGILMGNPLLPIKPCSFPAPCPGMDVDILDEDGKSVPPGKVGELVIKQPWIGMARGFWQEKERYLETYWSRFKNIWVHGDFAMRDKDNHWFILGRSDDTLKVAGKRVGPAEVESILVAHPLVTEAAVIGVPDEVKGTAMVAFCVLTGAQASLLASSPSGDENGSNHHEPSASSEADASRMLALQSELKSLVARDMGKPLAPSKIHFVSALPKTRNAKVMRRVLRSAYLGEDPGDLSALENPQAVDEIKKLQS